MSETLTAPVTPTARAAAWLARLEAALAARDSEAAAALFDDECYWRDLVSFTWNLRTEEGRDAIREMLDTPGPYLLDVMVRAGTAGLEL